MGSSYCIMATASLPYKVMGFRKKDLDKNWAQLVVRVNNLHKSRDKITISYPNERTEPLEICINGDPICTKLLPGSVIPSQCSFKTSYGEKGEVKVKLRKSEPEDWMHRWSPSRDTVQQQQPAIDMNQC